MSTPTPPFTGPITFSSGTSQSLKTSSAVGLPRMPIFGIFWPMEKPGMSFSMRKVVMPRLPSPVLA